MWRSDNIVTGEKLQQLADVYLGDPSDFQYNPCIATQTHKHQSLDSLPSSYSNPPIVFCYTHRLRTLADKLDAFQHPFVLITHNSDDAVDANDPVVQRIASCLKVQRWFAQNVGRMDGILQQLTTESTERAHCSLGGILVDKKIVPLPIGMANRQWPHGDIDFFDNQTVLPPKTRNIYFYFNIHTNPNKRQECYLALIHQLTSSPPMDPTSYKHHLAQHRFCICPEGNGYDTHRLWEAWYLRTIPVVVYSPFISHLLSTTNLPIIVVNSWSDVQPDTLTPELYENMVGSSTKDVFDDVLLSYAAWSHNIKQSVPNSCNECVN